MDKLLQPFPASFIAPNSDANIFVAASGELTGNKPSKLHRHDFYELVWLWQGDCTFFSDFELFPMRKGTLIFISPGQLHDYIIVESGFVRLLIFGFRPTLLPTVAQHLLNILPFDDTRRRPILEISLEYQTPIEQLFQAAHQRFDGRQAGWEAIVTTYLQTILTEATYLMPPEIIDQATNASVQLTRAFQSALEQHYQHNRQVKNYADMLGITSNHLVKTIRETTSMTPKQMLQNRLLLEAKRLLVHTPHPVNQISDSLEFPNSTTFARWFKKLSGQTPSYFRQQSLFTA